MPKRYLNLEVLEVEQLNVGRTSVSLMPCPCGTSGGISAGLGKFVPGLPNPWSAFWAVLAPTPVNEVDDKAEIEAYGHGSPPGNYGGDLAGLADSPDTGII